MDCVIYLHEDINKTIHVSCNISTWRYTCMMKYIDMKRHMYNELYLHEAIYMYHVIYVHVSLLRSYSG